MELGRYDDVILTQDLKEEGLLAGDIGTVIERHKVPGLESAYNIEFFDLLGNTVAVALIPANILRKPVPGDRPCIRRTEGSV